MAGSLYLIPNLLGLVPPRNVLPERTIGIASRLSHFIVENAKPARQFLKSIGTKSPIQELRIVEIGEDVSPRQCDRLLAPARERHDIGLLSNAGCPGIADPGALIVAAAHRENIQVVPLVGPSAVLLALMASGMNGQGFTFHGYLPIKTVARSDAIQRIEAASRETGYAQLFIEAPYRNTALLQTLSATLRAETRLCVAADLTADSETVESRPISDWRGRDFAPYSRRPAMFVLQA